MRVALPVYPYFKTASEVATLSYLADHTSIPVPRVLAHSSCASNDALGFEWILMTRLEGVPLRSLWSTPSLPWRGRVELTKTIAGYIDQMRMIRSQLLGNLYFTRDADDAQAMFAAFGQPNASPFEILEEDPKFSVGPICAIPFFYGDRIHLASDRGPWNSACAWIEAQLHLHITCVKKAIEKISVIMMKMLMRMIWRNLAAGSHPLKNYSTFSQTRMRIHLTLQRHQGITWAKKHLSSTTTTFPRTTS